MTTGFVTANNMSFVTTAISCSRITPPMIFFRLR